MIAYQRVKLSDLHQDPANARLHPDENLADIRASLKEFGQVEPLVVQKSSSKIIGGNGRYKVMLELGWTECDVAFVDMDNIKATALGIALNRAGERAEWDTDVLNKLLAEIGDDVSEELAASLKELEDEIAVDEPPGDADAEPQIDKAAELQRKWGTETRQLWLIGEHRLLCGDSTKREDVERVMGGEKAGLCFTSPPYAQQRDYRDETKEKVSDWDSLMNGVFGNLIMTEDAQVLVNLGLCHSDGEWFPYWNQWVEWMRTQGWRRFGWYVWDKISAPPGDWCGRCGPAHEWIFHFNKQSREANHIIPKKEESIKIKTGSSLRYKDGTLHTANYSPESGLNTHKIPDSVWRFHVARTGGKVEVAHPAVYPVELPDFAMQTFTQSGEIAYEPFSGSGTTFVAAQNLHRKCYGIEISPAYVAVILERMATAFPALEIRQG